MFVEKKNKKKLENFERIISHMPGFDWILGKVHFAHQNNLNKSQGCTKYAWDKKNKQREQNKWSASSICKIK